MVCDSGDELVPSQHEVVFVPWQERDNDVPLPFLPVISSIIGRLDMILMKEILRAI